MKLWHLYILLIGYKTVSLDYLYLLHDDVIRPKFNGNVHFLPRRIAVPDEIFRFSASTPSITPDRERKVKKRGRNSWQMALQCQKCTQTARSVRNGAVAVRYIL